MSDLTVCVHGFFRSARDMYFLCGGLRDAGFESIAVNLPTTFRSAQDCAALLDRKAREFAARYETVHYIGHSMGGLVIRKYLNIFKPAKSGKCVFIAVPHHGSRLADAALRIPGAGTLVPPLADFRFKFKKERFNKEKKGKKEENGENEYLLQDKSIAVGVIVGNKNTLLLGKLFLPRRSDGRVEVASAVSEDARETVALPYNHEEIHHVPETLELVKRFIKNGSFGCAGRSAI